MLKRALAVLLFWCLFWCATPMAFAEDRDFEVLVPAEVKVGALLRVELHAKESRAAAFRFSAAYDEHAVDFVRTETCDAVKAGSLFVAKENVPLRGVYACAVDGETAPLLDGVVITYVFRVLSEAPESLNFTVTIDQLCDYAGADIGASITQKLSTRVISSPSSAASAASGHVLAAPTLLWYLSPSEGTLLPAFSPEVFDYELPVPWDTSEIEFFAEAQEDGTVRVSRRTLQKAGSATQITITVTSYDGKTRTRYLVSVLRAERPLSEAADVSSKSPSKSSSRASSRASAPKAPSADEGYVPTHGAKEQDAPASGAVSEEPEESGGGQELVVQHNLTFIGDSFGSYAAGVAATVICAGLGYLLLLRQKWNDDAKSKRDEIKDKEDKEKDKDEKNKPT